MLQDFPGDSAVKNPPASAGNSGSIPDPERSTGEGNGNLLQYSYLENRGAWSATVLPGEQRSLIGYSPWDHKELDTT